MIGLAPGVLSRAGINPAASDPHAFPYIGYMAAGVKAIHPGFNYAKYFGGGIYSDWGLLTLNGSSSVTGNSTEGGFGGGIYTEGAMGTFSACTTWTGALSPNSPDDPPTPTIVTTPWPWCSARATTTSSRFPK